MTTGNNSSQENNAIDTIKRILLENKGDYLPGIPGKKTKEAAYQVCIEVLDILYDSKTDTATIKFKNNGEDIDETKALTVGEVNMILLFSQTGAFEGKISFSMSKIGTDDIVKIEGASKLVK